MTSREPEFVVGVSGQRDLLDRLERIAQTDAEILITGPTGVGKELYAHFAHDHSRRAGGPFVIVNCGNLGGDLLENEVFGHARGAYTGAHAAGEGLAASAEGGTLFLDEIDALPLVSQAKLLRFIQQREYRRLGETFVRRANIRIIAASNCDLPTLVRCGRFREDLYFRLRVAPIVVPPLAARPGDIHLFVEHFRNACAAEYGVKRAEFGPSAMERMLAHDWPGNVRELENLVRYVTCLQLDREVDADDLTPLDLPGQPGENRVVDMSGRPMRRVKEELIEDFERIYINQALGRSGGNITKAAEQSGKHRRAFYELMRKHGMKRGDYGGD